MDTGLNVFEKEDKSFEYQEAEKMGVDTSTIAICRKIRRLAKLDRLLLDESLHRFPQNKHLFDYINFCGKDVLEFIKEYLSNIQPYMITRNQKQEPDKHFICVIDNQYAVSLYIKLNATQHEEVVVSFHENHIRGIAKQNRLLQTQRNQLVPVFAESVQVHVENTNNYVVRVLVQRGMLILPLSISAQKCADVFLTYKSNIDTELINYCNEYLRDLYTSDLELDFDKIELFSILQQISFTSYGRDIFSSLSLLVDNLYIQPDKLSRSAADFALVTYTQNLLVTVEQKEELCKMLEEKFQITSHKDIDIVLARIEDSFQVEQEQSLVASDEIIEDIDSEAKYEEIQLPEMTEKKTSEISHKHNRKGR